MIETAYTGHRSQLFDVRRSRLVGGKADGMEVIDIWNGGNLSLTLLPSRCCDIYSVRFRGNSMAFHTPAGLVHPAFYQENRWLRSFAGGFLTTCGLQNVGAADPIREECGTHGRIANTPSDNTAIQLSEDGQSVRITAEMQEAVLFGARLRLRRTMEVRRGCDEILFTDTVTNLGWKEEPLSMLYHFNMGYPLIDADARVVIPSHTVVPRNAHAASGLADWQRLREPEPDFEEMCYYHFLRENYAGIDSPNLNTRVRIHFDSPDGVLDRLVEWKMMGCGDYVVGLEPISCTLEGQSDAEANGSLKHIAPQSSITNHFRITFGGLTE